MNKHYLWNSLDSGDRENYIHFLGIFGSISGLFKDITEGSTAKKPYLYYRNHEQLFARVFQVKDLTRSDSAFDAIAEVSPGRKIGVGLKTWLHTRDKTYQKVAEFNKAAPIEIDPIIAKGNPEDVIAKVSFLRNERILLDKRQYNTYGEVYHSVTRDDNVMYIVESSYDLIQIDNLKLEKTNGKTYHFNDGLNNYKYYRSKSVLMKEFDASKDKIIERIPITLYEDPFDLLEMIQLPKSKAVDRQEIIYLPLYSDSEGVVSAKSGLNSWNSKPKSKINPKPRPEFEAYIPIPVWIHKVYFDFFGFDALNKDERGKNNPFTLHLPDGRKITAIVTQSNGKALQTNPQNVLGKWLLHDVLNLKSRELLTTERLYQLGVDSIKLTKLDNQNFKIELADLYTFENWKIENKDFIENTLSKLNGKTNMHYRDIDN